MSDKQEEDQAEKNIMSYLQVPDIHNNNNNNKQQHQQQNIIQKKHSGPLDAALDEIRRQEEEAEAAEQNKSSKETKEEEAEYSHVAAKCVPSTTSAPTTRSHLPFHPKKHPRKHERWLLTRKTWKFMQDAGRKLLPDGVQNRKEDIPYIEMHFQQLCANEQRFLLWKRKLSFPGARRTSMRHNLPLIKRHQRNLNKNQEYEESEQLLQMLTNYIELTDQSIILPGKGAQTALLSAKTQQPHQTLSPSAQRPLQQQQQQQEKDTLIQLEDIMLKLRQLSAHAHNAFMYSELPRPELITHDLLQNKTQLRQIYNALKRQQLHRQLNRHATPLLPARRRHSLTNVFGTTTIPLTTASIVNERPKILALKRVNEIECNKTTTNCKY